LVAFVAKKKEKKRGGKVIKNKEGKKRKET
jgi:hypothetical protein